MARMPPLAELHLHLEGAIEPETLREIDPALSFEEIEAATTFQDFAGFLESFKWVNRRLQRPEDYAVAARRLFERLESQGVVYAEVILSAGVILWKEQEFSPVWDALASEARRAKMQVRWIFDAIRHFGPEPAATVFDLAADRRDEGVVAIGIGGDEARGPASWFTELYQRARDRGLRLTAHAGETAGPESVIEALAIGAERIGHGIRAVEDPALVQGLQLRDIPLEVCITSNLCTGAVRGVREHPVRKLFDAGVPITLSTDDPSLFRTNLTREYEIARESFRFSNAEMESLRVNSFTYAFDWARPSPSRTIAPDGSAGAG